MPKIRLYKILILLILLTGYAYPQYPPPSTSFRIFPSTITQTEPIVCISPLNRMIMFGSSYTINTASGFISVGTYISTNGGYNWFGSDTCKGQNMQNYGGDPGVSIDKNGTFIITHIGNPSVITGVYSHFSTNMGVNWSNASTITSLQPEDKGSSTADNSPTSPFYGRVYAAWVNLTVFPAVVQFSHSTNSAVSWSSPMTVNPSPPQRCSGSYIETGTDGTIYICWAGASTTFPFPSQYAGFAKSTNGGANWNVNQNIYSLSGIEPTIQQKGNIRVNSIPRFDIDRSGGSRNGWIYMVSAEKGAGADSADIILHRSTNNGVNWSSGIRVNQDAHNNGKIQYCPAICVDSTGAVNVLFYDDRNTTSDSAEVMLARSKDGGITWNEFRVSSHKFKPKPIVGSVSNYQGDFITVISAGNKIFTYWMDDYSGIYQCWSSIIDINTIGIRKIENEIPGKFELGQNYPNPFNPSTNIRYNIPDNGFVTLKVYGITGRLVSTLVNQEQSAGTYETQFSALQSSESQIASGTYFYKLEFVSKSGIKSSQTKKLVVLK